MDNNRSTQMYVVIKVYISCILFSQITHFQRLAPPLPLRDEKQVLTSGERGPTFLSSWKEIRVRQLDYEHRYILLQISKSFGFVDHFTSF